MLNFKPMLAGSVEDVNKLAFPLYASPKLDGIRAIIIDGVVMSRNLKPIPNLHVQKLFGKKKYNGLDGELIVGSPTAKDAFRATTSAVMSEDGKPNITFYVFDYVCDTRNYEQRTAKVAATLTGTKLPFYALHSQLVEDVDQLAGVESQYLTQGFEGVMLRHKTGPYKFGRSTLREGYLLKLKRFADSEAEILWVVEQLQNTNEATKDELGRTERSSKKAGLVGKNTMGALLVRDVKTKVEFQIGTGFDDAWRAHFWGMWQESGMEIERWTGPKFIKYRYFPTGSKDKPRFPVFAGFRDPIDM